MSDTSAFGFGQFVPGFDFLQNLSKNAAQAQPSAAVGMPGMGSWVAPTLSIEDIDKRIQELKSVLFWLEQNTTALKATIQAMEVQKMTLTTLQSMNVNMADLAKAFTARPPVSASAAAASDAPSTASAAPASGSDTGPAPAPRPSLFMPKSALQAVPVSEPQNETASPADASEPAPAPTEQPANAAGQPAVDPMQWWGALTQQFQGIAAAALKDVAGEAMKAGMAAKAATPAKTARKPASGAKGPASAAPSRGKSATAVKPQTVRAAPGKTTRSAAKTATKSSASVPRKAAKK